MFEGLPPADELPDLIKKRRRPLPVYTRVLAFVGGVIFILLGIIGWLLPLVTGIPFYIVGFGLLGLASGSIRKWINKADKRLPYKARLCLRPKLLREAHRKRRASR